MARVEHADTAEFPATHDFPEGAAAVQKSLAGSEGQFVDRVGGEVVPYVKDAGPFVAM